MTDGKAVSLIAWVVDAPSWQQEATSLLAQSGFEVAVFSELDSIRGQTSAVLPDAFLIIAASIEGKNLAGINELGFQCPKILITELSSIDAGSLFAALPGIDFVLASAPKLLAYQLKSLIQNYRLQAATARKLAERDEELRQLQSEVQLLRRNSDEIEVLKNAIVRNVSHELKTPLLQVKSAVSLLAEDLGSSKLIDYATDATARLELLVRNITLLGSSLDINPGPVIVRDAIESARRNLRRIWQRKDETERIVVLLENHLPPVLADKQGLSTVLQLLIDNALKFSKKNIEVCAQRSEDSVELTIRDYGIGIAKDQLELIFDLFYQVDHSSTRRYGGTGVGLAIVKLILDRHNTKILVESSENIGSSFSFRLPIIKY